MYKILLILFFIILKSFSQPSNLPSIHTTSNKIDIKDGNTITRGNWTLMPVYKPDVYKTAISKNETRKITFYSDIDSISFEVEKNKIYNFNIILNKKDTCWTQINTVPNFNFSEEYIKKNKGKYSFEIPEVQELVHIMIALTPVGLKDKGIVEHKGKYYKSVIKYFEKYKNEPIIHKINNFLEKDVYGYTVLKMDACSYIFNNDKIIKDGTYDKLSWDGENYAEPFIEEIEAFAKLTNFRKFYSDNKLFYKEQIYQMEVQIPVEKQWKWLENNFKIKYDNYRITFSPLVSGSHSTNKFIQDGFKQTVMFICGPLEKRILRDEIIEGLMSRVVFTEIDHNYVNPISDIFKQEINNALINIEKWATKNAFSNYPCSYAVFNEYMTFGVFTLYVLENFSREDFKKINNLTVRKMNKRRGFIKFNEFNEKLIELYKSKDPGSSIESIYPKIIKWCSEQ